MNWRKVFSWEVGAGEIVLKDQQGGTWHFNFFSPTAGSCWLNDQTGGRVFGNPQHPRSIRKSDEGWFVSNAIQDPNSLFCKVADEALRRYQPQPAA